MEHPEFNNELHSDEVKIKGALDGWRDSADSRAERPEWFWTRQRARVMAQIGELDRKRSPKLAWAGIAATVALALALIAPAKQPKPVEPVALAPAQLSDHDLMVALERTMNAGIPSSLEPAGMLAQEMNQALVTKAQTHKSKEKNYED